MTEKEIAVLKEEHDFMYTACMEALAHFERELADDPALEESDFAEALSLCRFVKRRVKPAL